MNPELLCDDIDAFTGVMVGNSMEPLFQDGDEIVFSPEAEVVDGCFACIKLTDGSATFKRLRLGEDIVLEPINPAHPPRTVADADVLEIARAVAVWRSV